MSLKTIDCRIIVCDSCGAKLDNGDGMIPHFDEGGWDEPEMYLEDAGWIKTPKGADICTDCFPPHETVCLTCNHPLGEHELWDEQCLEEGCECELFNWEPEPKKENV